MLIRLFGGLEVLSADGAPLLFATRKAGLVLAALVLAGRRGLRRGELAEGFWPHRGAQQARNSLRQALVDIRRPRPSYGAEAIRIAGEQETIMLDAALEQADVWSFDRLVRSGATADLAAAADLYRGELLAGQSLSDGLDDWFAPYRSQYQHKALQLVEQISLASPVPGSPEEIACAALADRLVAADSTAEAAHRALVRVYQRRGQENMALRQFELCRAALAKELGLEPEAQTKTLADAVRAQAGGKPSASAPQQREALTANHTAAATRRGRPSLAVLPFQNLSSDGNQDYFADGVVEEITTALARFRHLLVISRSSSFAYKGRPFDVGHVGRELDVRYVVEGSVRRAGGQLRITAQLVDTATSTTLWADRFDGAAADLFDLQERVAVSIVGAITPSVEAAEIARARHKPTASLDAYDCYLRGIALMDKPAVTREATDEAYRLFGQAITQDPDFALAHARAARCFATRKSNRWMVDVARETAEATRLARKAVELGGDDAVALSFGGFILGYVGGDLEEGAACIDRALVLNPNLAVALGYSSWVQACIGEPERAIDHATRAMGMSPLDTRLFAWQFCAALGCFCAGRYDDAAGWARSALRSKANYASATRIAAASYALAGRSADARDMIKRLLEIDPDLRLSNLDDVLPPLRRQIDRQRIVQGLAKAGLT